MDNHIKDWIKDTLWKPWGWHDLRSSSGLSVPHRKADQERVESAVTFALRVLGNDDSPETQAVVDAINKQRAMRAVRA